MVTIKERRRLWSPATAEEVGDKNKVKNTGSHIWKLTLYFVLTDMSISIKNNKKMDIYIWWLGIHITKISLYRNLC